MYVLRSILVGYYSDPNNANLLAESLSDAARFDTVTAALNALQAEAVNEGRSVGNFEILKVSESVEVVE